MGMFDYVKIDFDMLPLTDEEKAKYYENKLSLEFQTKDFDCEMTEIHITKDGELKINRWEYEEVPKEERPYPNDEGLKGLFGSLRRKNERLETVNYHGYVYFYSMDLEFSAKFTDGKLVEIKRIDK